MNNKERTIKRSVFKPFKPLKRKVAIITGITGQTGSYLAELLLEKEYYVYGIVRRTSSGERVERLEHIKNDIDIIDGDITDAGCMAKIIGDIKPDELYHCAAMSFVGVSWNQPTLTFDVNIKGTLNLLEAIRYHSPKTKFVHASSSEMFGSVLETPQKETTPFNPRSPYGVSKTAAHYITKNYRESFNLFATNYIAFNHESKNRGPEFVTRKISIGVAQIYHGLSNELWLGDLKPKRDWSHAKDIVKGAWMILQHYKPDDFVLASGETHSVQEFVQKAFSVAGIKNWQKYIKQDKKLIRPAEVNVLLGDYSKAKKVLGWEPEISFEELVKEMVENDIKLIERQKSK